MRAGTAVRSLGKSRVARSRYIFLQTQLLTDKLQANLLVCSGAVGIRRHCRRSRCRSGGASRLQGARKREFAAPQRTAHRTQSPAFWSLRCLMVPTRREQKFAVWPATLECSSLRFPPFLPPLTRSYVRVPATLPHCCSLDTERTAKLKASSIRYTRRLIKVSVRRRPTRMNPFVHLYDAHH